MNKIVLTVALMFAVTPAFAHSHQGPVGPQGPQGEQGAAGDTGHRAFDGGPAAQVVLFETQNTEWGTQGTYDVGSKDTRVYGYGKIFLNRIWQKK